jgi:hypothetical protein
MAFLQEVVDETVPWRRRSVHSTPWWSDEISQAVHEERGLKRLWLRTRSDSDQTRLLEASDRKKLLIKNAKRKTFREQVDEASREPEGV